MGLVHLSKPQLNVLCHVSAYAQNTRCNKCCLRHPNYRDNVEITVF